MHDRTRRFFLLLIFLVLGPGLTLVLLGAIGVRRSPIALKMEEKAVRNLGNWDVHIGSVEYVNVNHRRYRDFTILHPGTLEALIVVPELEVRSFRSKSEAAKDTLVVRAATVRLNLGPRQHRQQDHEALSEVFFSLFQRRFHGEVRNVQVNFENVELLQADPNEGVPPTILQSFSFVKGQYLCEADGESLECHFSLPENIAADPVRFSLKKFGRNTNQPSTSYELLTGKTPMQCRLLSLVLPEFALFGEDAVFSGTLKTQITGKNQFVFSMDDVAFKNVTLEPLAKRFTSFHLRGSLSFALKRFSFQQSEQGVEHISGLGWFQVRDGSMEKQLLNNLCEHYRLSASSPTTKRVFTTDPLIKYSPEKAIPFWIFGAYFELDDQGCLLQGGAVDKTSTTILRADGRLQYALPEEPSRWYSFSSLLDPLMPVEAELVPLTRKSLSVLRFLPREAFPERVGETTSHD